MKAEHEKSLDEIKSELDKLKKEGVDEIILPCNCDSRKDFFDILEHAKSQGLNITLESNGRMFFYPNFVMKTRGLVDSISVIYWGEDDAHDAKTRVKESGSQAKAGTENIEKAKIPYKIKRLYPDDEKVFYDKPREISIEVTTDCNFNCEACFNQASFAQKGRKRAEMSSGFIKKVIDSAADFGVPAIRFSGGEPLLRKDLFELMEYARSRNLRVWMNTNAALVTEDVVRKLEKYVENVLIPLNGYDSQSDFIWTSTKNSFRDKIRGMRLLRKSSIRIVRSGTVATPENIKNLEKIYAIIKSEKLDGWEVYRPVPIKEDLAEFDVQALVGKLARLSADFGKLIQIANAVPLCSHDPEKLDAFCAGAKYDDGHSRITVDPRGFAKPGYFLDVNIGDPRHIEKCWNNDFMKKVRQLKFANDKCKDCSYLDKCKGGLLYAAKLVNGSYSALDPLARPEKWIR